MSATLAISEDHLVPSQLPDLADFRFCLRTFLNFSERQAEALGITVQQYQMLQVIANSEDQRCSISHLAGRLLLRHNSSVELVDRGERSGLLHRIADASDHRRSLLELTEQGSRVLTQLVREHLNYLRQDGPTLAAALERIIAGSLREHTS